jgi:tetratricopeptide (TPR) repeat protein
MNHSIEIRLSRRMNRRLCLATTAALVTAALSLPLPASAADLNESIAALQHEWEVVRYRVPRGEREQRFEALAAKARGVSEAFGGRSEPLVWEGIIVSSWAGEKGGLDALGLVKQAKALYEEAIRIDGRVLEGAAYNSLGVLYYKVPGWPIGFGDKDKARKLLQQALAINPDGIDPNFFFGEFLLETGHGDQAASYLERSLQAASRPGREIADDGRREEARALLAKARAQR